MSFTKKRKILLTSLILGSAALTIANLTLSASCENKKEKAKLENYAKTLTLIPTKGTVLKKNENITTPEFLQKLKTWTIANSEGVDPSIKVDIKECSGQQSKDKKVYYLVLVELTLNKTKKQEYIWVEVTKFLEGNNNNNGGGGGNNGGGGGITPEPTGDTYNLKLAHWNVCQFSEGSFSERKPKGEAIASIIYHNKFDICGLTEVDGDGTSPQKLADLLNEIEQKNNTNNNWKSITSDRYGVANAGQGAQADYGAAFVYKSNLVDTIAFKDGSVGKFYDNSTYETHFGGDWTKYSRAPYGVRFQSKFSNIKNDFTFVVCHFDGPGVKAGEVKAGNGGSGEYNDAWNLQHALDWFNKEADDDDIIFQGDTNIKKKKAGIAFEWLNNRPEYKMLIDDTAENATSLKQTIGKYGEPYDKIIFNSNLRYSNVGFYKIYDFPTDNIFQFATINSHSDWFNYASSNASNPPTSEVRAIYGFVSDHCPTYFDLELNSNDPK